MTERLKVSPVEASVILVNEIFGGHYSEKIAKTLHNHGWKRWYHPETNPLKPEGIMDDAQRSQLLIVTQEYVLQTLTDREKKAIRLRFGKEDGVVHTLKEVGGEFGVGGVRSSQIIEKALRKLRHPSRSKLLKGFLPESL